MNLQNAVAIVTGGAQNIGLGIAKELVARGCRVVILDVSPLDEQDSQSERLTGWVCDVSNRAEVNQALTRLHEFYGCLYLVVIGA